MFGGVFTPSILTILGVIMYLRLPWVLGHAGLYLTLGIIVAAHVISVTTGLSVSSIATDKRVEAGGAYYIVSRSMGLAIGGTLGMALFVGLSFSISLYVIGFSESFLSFWGFSTDLQTIRLCGTISLVALTLVTFISTSLAIRSQYLIFGLIVLSLVSIFMGTPSEAVESAHLAPYPNGEAATLLFGIFFPAVTGFTTGVNMSGDLRDPRRAIPTGTMLAIGTGLLVYIGLAAFLAFKVPAEQLVNNGQVLLDIAWSPNAVVAGIWGATLSSALGSILGAPRILQALSQDHITPRLFAVGHGPSNEPRYALVLAFLIGEIGILIGELDAIARVVSVFFIATYGFLNLSASFEMIASPDFRPDFKIPRWVPVLGAATCGILMVWLDLIALLGAVVVMSALFVLLKRRELQLETGDTLLGVWSSVVRAGLQRLSTESLHQRHWRPNIVLFTEPGHESRHLLLDLGYALTRHRGVATEFLLTREHPEEAGGFGVLEEEPGARPDADGADEAEAPERPTQAGFFHRKVPLEADEAVYDTMEAVCRFHGFSGLQPNTVMLDWHQRARDPESFAGFLELLEQLDYNVMSVAFHPDRRFGAQRHVDLWWSAEAGSLALSIALVRFITSADEWRRAELRFFVICDDASLVDALHRSTSRAVADARFEGTVKVINNALEGRKHEEWITQYSANTDLVVLGLPNRQLLASDITRTEHLVRRLGCALILRPSSQFEGGFGQVVASTVNKATTEVAGARHPVHLPRLRLPETPDLARPAALFSEQHTALMTELCDRSARHAFAAQASLVTALCDEVDLQYREFEAVMEGAGERRRALTLERGPEALLRKVQDLLDAFESAELARIVAGAEAGVDKLLTGIDALEAEIPSALTVTRLREDFAVDPQDPPYLRRLKARRRTTSRLLRRPPSYRVKPRRLARYYLRHRTIELARRTLTDVASHGLVTADELGRAFHVLKGSLDAIQRKFRAGTLDHAFLGSERQRVMEHLRAMQHAQEEAGDHRATEVMLAARALEQQLTDDLDRVDVARLTRWFNRERRVPRDARAQAEGLRALPQAWADRQVLFLRRATLPPLLGTVQSRLQTAIHEATRTLDALMETGVLGRCRALVDGLQAYRQAAVDLGADAPLELQARLEGATDEAQIIEDLHQALQAATSHVPESLRILREDSVQALSAEPFREIEVAEIALRRQLQFLVDSELVGPVQELLSDVPRAEQRATSVAEDVVRLITFTRTDLAGSPSEEAARSLVPVVDNGIERVQVELARLEELGRSLSERIQARLEHVLDLTNNFAILGTAEAFEAHGRRAPKLTGLERLSERARSEVKRALVALAYRRSAGELFARRIREEDAEGSSLDAVHALVDACAPRREVLDSLPFYYAQLFLGQSNVHSAFWVGREAELQQIERAVARYDRGAFGSIVITGEPGSGKTALCGVAVERFLAGRPVYWVSPPPGGSASASTFRSTLQHELRMRGSVQAMFEALPERAVVVLHNAELWWERSPAGFEVLDLIGDIVERYGDRVLFLIELGLPAWKLLRSLAAFSGEAVVHCGPVDAEALKDIVLLRHNSTGLRFAIDGRSQDEVSEWALAQLFTAHFRHSQGNIGAALASWVAHVTSFADGTLNVGTPGPQEIESLRAMPPEWSALLLQLVLHKELTVGRLQRITGLQRSRLVRDLAALRRVGLVVQRRRDVVELEPGVQHLVTAFLRLQGALP